MHPYDIYLLNEIYFVYLRIYSIKQRKGYSNYLIILTNVWIYYSNLNILIYFMKR